MRLRYRPQNLAYLLYK